MRRQLSWIDVSRMKAASIALCWHRGGLRARSLTALEMERRERSCQSRPAWWSSDLELRGTRPGGLTTGLPRLQPPNWALQLPCSLHAICDLCQQQNTQAGPVTAVLRNPELPWGHGYDRFRSWEVPQAAGRTPGRGLGRRGKPGEKL